MKWKMFSVSVLLALSVLAVNGFTGQKDVIKVSGKCGMCETRIEKAALSVKGVESAEWDKESGQLEVVYDAGKANRGKIQKAIAKAGHDTELYAASDKVYEKLPAAAKPRVRNRTVKPASQIRSFSSLMDTRMRTTPRRFWS